MKKVALFIIVGIAHLTDVHLLGDGNALRTAVIFFYCSNEAISLLENCGAIGIPIPKTLQKALTQIKKKSESSDKDGKGNDHESS